MTVDARGACLITGVAGGVGKALAQAFHEAGYFVVGTDRTLYSSQWIDRFIHEDILRIVTNDECATGFFEVLEACLGGRPLRVLINNAAVQVLGGVEELSISDWDETFRVNVVAPFFLAKRLLVKLHGGSIINVSSIHARLTKKNFVAYATSKAALTGLTKSLAVDIGDRVRVNAIEPAALDTEMLRRGFVGQADKLAKLAAHHPTGSFGQPREVGRLAVLMANADFPFMNGSVIGMDGGIASRLHDPE